MFKFGTAIGSFTIALLGAIVSALIWNGALPGLSSCGTWELDCFTRGILLVGISQCVAFVSFLKATRNTITTTPLRYFTLAGCLICGSSVLLVGTYVFFVVSRVG